MLRLPESSRRLRFRAWTEADLPLAWALWGDPEVTRLIDARGRLTKAGVQEKLDEQLALQRVHGLGYWPIFLRASDRFVGCCGLRPYAPGTLEVGFHIRSDCWGRGYAPEAAEQVMDFAFDALGADALFAGHNPDNTASKRLLAALGFRFTHEELYPPTGRQHPSYLLRSDEHQRMVVREEQPGDGELIHALNRAAFESDAEARLVDALRDDDALLLSLSPRRQARSSATSRSRR